MASLGLRIRRGRRRLMFVAMRTVMRLAGFRGARPIGWLLGDLQYFFARGDRERHARDMAAALGRAPDDREVRRQLRYAYRVNTAAVLEILSMFDRRQDDRMLAAQCEIEGLERLQAAMAGGRGAILLPSHMGNGAALAARLAIDGWPVTVVYKQARMMSVDFFARGLPLYGIEGILANEGLKAYGKMLGALRQGRVVFVMIDQGVKSAKDGVMQRFLGKDVPMPPGPAQLARHAKSPVLPVATVGAEPVWKFAIEPPLERTAGAPVEDDVALLVRTTERLVLQHPELWSWPHRRWRLYPAAPAAGSAS